MAKFSSQGHQKTFKKLWFCYIKACGTLASGAPSASLPRSGRSAPSLRPLRSVAPGARLARFGRSARSRIEPSARSLHGPWLWSSCCSLASLAHSTRPSSHGPWRERAERPTQPRAAPEASQTSALRSLAARPPLARKIPSPANATQRSAALAGALGQDSATQRSALQSAECEAATSHTTQQIRLN